MTQKTLMTLPALVGVSALQHGVEMLSEWSRLGTIHIDH